MSPELLQIYSKSGFGEFNPEKSDIFSTGLTFLRLTLSLLENYIDGMNSYDRGQYFVNEQISNIKHSGLCILLSEML